MSIEITRPGKHMLSLTSPVMPAAGVLGFGDSYRDMVNFDKLGALVTNPVTYEPWSPAGGMRVVHLDAGALVHTGNPNPGLSKVISKYREMWTMLPMPVILHLICDKVEHIRKSASRIDSEESINALELGLNDDITNDEAYKYVRAAVERTEKPVIVRLPLQDAYAIADSVVDAGAASLVVAAPPRGTARDKYSGQLVSGRVYGPMVLPIVLRVVEILAKRIKVPIIGAGGIHSPEDARDYIRAGAVAVQVDSVAWINPKMLEVIGRDLGGLVVTRESGAYPDEWYPGMGNTTRDLIQGKEMKPKDKK
jgi:dihydroorotate dehydrogenase (NAD+) catalytic subunit